MLRLLLIPLLSLILSSSAFAETIPATSTSSGYYTTSWTSGPVTWAYALAQSDSVGPCKAGTVYSNYNATWQASPFTDGAIAHNYAGALNDPGGAVATTSCWMKNPAGSGSGWYSPPSSSMSRYIGYVCPSGENWTLNGQTCTRPDCPQGTTRKPDGTCQDPCQTKVDLGTKYGIYNFPVGTSITGTYCDGGCRLALGSTAQPYYTDGKTVTKVISQTYLLGSCTASDGTAPSPGAPGMTPPDPPKKPPCADGEGVMTSSTGAVHCVPSGIPGSNTPKVTKETTKSTAADGSTTTKETTTTRDPTTGVEEKTVTTTQRNGSGQITGVTGETTTTGTTKAGDPTKPENSKFCAENPDLQICKGGMNEEKTQVKVQEAVEKVRDALDAQSFDPDSFFVGKDVSPEARSDVTDKLNAAKADIVAIGSGGGPSAESYGAFQTAMGNWFEPLTISGCSPFTVRVGNWTWTHNHCDVAAKISEIGAYCMWVMLAFGVFGMTTRDHR